MKVPKNIIKEKNKAIESKYNLIIDEYNNPVVNIIDKKQ